MGMGPNEDDSGPRTKAGRLGVVIFVACAVIAVLIALATIVAAPIAGFMNSSLALFLAIAIVGVVAAVLVWLLGVAVYYILPPVRHVSPRGRRRARTYDDDSSVPHRRRARLVEHRHHGRALIKFRQKLHERVSLQCATYLKHFHEAAPEGFWFAIKLKAGFDLRESRAY
jgi:hypothetical protein